MSIKWIPWGVAVGLLGGIVGYAVAEDITLSTYYPISARRVQGAARRHSPTRWRLPGRPAGLHSGAAGDDLV